MHRREFLTALLACPLCAMVSAAHADRLRGRSVGAVGKSIVDPNAGMGREPIDLSGRLSERLDLVSTHWPSMNGLVLRNDGETLQVEVPDGHRSFVQGREFKLLALHLHRAAAHRVGERSYPFELHFVHEAAEGDLMILGVLLEAGSPRPVLTPLLQAAPYPAGEVRLRRTIELQKLLPQDAGYYSYASTPSEQTAGQAVTWVLYDRPLSASQAQIDAFAALFPYGVGPDRPSGHHDVLLSS